MPPYRTIDLRLPEATYEELRRRASDRGVPMAEVVRDAVVLYLGRDESPRELAFGGDPADALVGALCAGVDDESVAHDQYLYGWPK